MAWLEIALLLVLAFQIARLFWAAVTPIGPVGAWQPRAAAELPASARQALFARLDPFFRGQAAAGPTQVTSLSLKLFGIRVNEASGGGSAIVAGPDGIQQSFGIGDEIVPGVVLKAVALDHVVITRGGSDESLYLDQSQPAPVVQADGSVAPPTAPNTTAGPPLQTQIGFEPRLAGGQLSGLTVSPRGDGAAFKAAGLQAGDVVVAVDGKPIRSIADVQALEGRAPGSQVSIAVERGGQRIPLSIVMPNR